MSLFNIAMEYASHRTLSWGRMLICGRSDDAFSYRIIIANRAPVPVLSVPNSEIDGKSLALLSWLFGRHSVFAAGGLPASCPDAWREAEYIYTDLCMLADVTPDVDAFLLQRQLLTKAS